MVQSVAAQSASLLQNGSVLTVNVDSLSSVRSHKCDDMLENGKYYLYSDFGMIDLALKKQMFLLVYTLGIANDFSGLPDPYRAWFFTPDSRRVYKTDSCFLFDIPSEYSVKKVATSSLDGNSRFKETRAERVGEFKKQQKKLQVQFKQSKKRK